MNLGVRAHNFGKLPLEMLVDKVAKKKFSSVQLALAKAVKDIDTDNGRFSHGMACHIGNAFRNRGIQIAVLGCYINLVHPDLSVRKKSLERFKEHIRYARDFGCSIVATETGNLNVDSTFNNDNYGEEALSTVIESVSKLVEEAEKFGVIVGIEAGTKSPIHSSKRMKSLLDAVKSNNLQVVFDPLNLMTAENYKEQEKVFDEAMNLFGDRIVVVHAKDLILQGGNVKTTPPGKGLLNYEYIFKLIKHEKPYINILLEDVKEPDMDSSIAFLKEKFSLA